MGKKSRTKGGRVERLVCNLFRAWGLRAEKVPLSGATSYARGDVDVYRKIPALVALCGPVEWEDADAPFIGEVKARADGFKQLYAWLEKDDADYLALKADHKDVLFVLPERVMRELLCQ